MIESAVATHTNGFEDPLYCAVNSMIRCFSSVTLRNVVRLMARSLSSPNQRSTWFSQEA